MSGSKQSYTNYLTLLGGTLRFYYPLTDEGPVSSTYPPATPWEMTQGTITNKSYNAGAVLTQAYGDTTMTAPVGAGTVHHRMSGGGNTPVVIRDTNWSSVADTTAIFGI
jgi:hypothetical protein